MVQVITTFTTLSAVVAAALLRPSSAHTWIDCLDTDRSVVYDNARDWIYGGVAGNGLCSGYMKNYAGRGDPAINDKMTHKILMEDVPNGMPVCEGGEADYSGWRTRLQVKAGEQFYYAYTPNGHVVKDKAGRGTWYGTYWTGQPGSSLELTTDLTEDKLIDGQMHDYDDGNCGESFEDGAFSGNVPSGRAGNDHPCVGTLSMPAGTAPGVYNLVWFWKFYNDEGVNANIKTTGGSYGGAAYSSCYQVEVVAGGDSGADPSNESEVVPTPAPEPETPAPEPETPAPEPETEAPEPEPETEAPEPETEAPEPETEAPEPETEAPESDADSEVSEDTTPAMTPSHKDCEA